MGKINSIGLAIGLTSAALAVMSAVGCVSVEADVQDVVVTTQALQIDGTAIPIDLGEREISVRFDHPYGGVDIPEGVDSDLRPTGASIVAVSGVDDLSFLSGFVVSMGSTAPEAPPPAVVFEYQRQGAGPVGPSIGVSPVSHPDVLDYWERAGTYYELTVRGDLPELLWAVDVIVEFSGKVSVDI